VSAAGSKFCDKNDRNERAERDHYVKAGRAEPNDGLTR